MIHILELGAANHNLYGIYFQNDDRDGVTTQAADCRPMLEFHQSTIAVIAA
jgi:hypothetical protein